MITDILKVLRPKHWIKNVFVFGPVVFSHQFLLAEPLVKSGLAFIIFSLMASALYIFNDIMDRQSDAKHPSKKHRPIASGRISVPTAYGIIAILALISAGGIYILPDILPMLGVYIIMIILYSIWLKNIAVVDICIVASGFVLRTFVGGDAIGVPHSNWMSITVFCLALFLIVTKRRQELIRVGHTMRQSLQQYTVSVLDKFIILSAGATFVFYTLFVALNKPQMAPSVPFVLFGLMRYILLLENKNTEDPTDTLTQDIPILLNAVLWGVSVLFVLI